MYGRRLKDAVGSANLSLRERLLVVAKLIALRSPSVFTRYTRRTRIVYTEYLTRFW